MMLSGKKVCTYPISHPLAKLTPKRIDEARLNELVIRFRNGDVSQDIKDEIILGHVHYAIHVAARYAYFFPRREEVFVSEAIYGIIYAVDKFLERTEGNIITPWIVSCCHRFVADFLCKDFVIPIKKMEAYKRRRAKLRISTTLVSIEKVKFEETQNRSPVKKEQYSTYDLHDLREMIQLSTSTKVEKEIVQLRIKGYNDREIGEQLGYVGKYITRLRDNIRTKFEVLKNVY